MNKWFRTSIVILLTTCTALPSFSQEIEKTGEVRGKVIDKQSHERIEWVNIEVMGTLIRTFSLEDGSFRTRDLPVGTYRIKAHRIGYRQLVKTDIVVSTGRP